MSIRLRFTLLYNAILALTLLIIGIVLYSIQAQTTLDALKEDLIRSSNALGGAVMRSVSSPFVNGFRIQVEKPPPMPFDDFSEEQAFQRLPEREIVRVLDITGTLVASPFGSNEDALPLSSSGLTVLQEQQDWWETATVDDQSMLIYTRQVSINGEPAYLLQVARPLTERNRSLQALSATLLGVSLVTLLAAFGIGWILAGITLRPIQRITQTARSIGEERDLTRRVDYTGPQDEVGQLATTFNTMLARIEEAYQRVARSLEMQRNFVADVSHELRTPLTTLRGNLGLLKRTPPIPAEEHNDVVDDMVDESDRLIRLVNDLLVLARADAGRNFSHEAVDIAPLLTEACRQARQLAPDRKINLESAVELVVQGDRDAIKQVLLIALDNAIKHSDGDIDVFAGQQGDWIEIRFRDHGPGIPPEKLAHVFDRFYRGEEAAIIPGFGLGLPIAKSLVEALQGTIALESRPGMGSELIIRLIR
jgi:signal transduction histidine kinase